MPYVLPSGSGVTTITIPSSSVLSLTSTHSASPVRAPPSSMSISTPISPKSASTFASPHTTFSLYAPPAPVPDLNIVGPTPPRTGYLYPPPLTKAFSETHPHRLSSSSSSATNFMQAAAAARGQYTLGGSSSSSSSTVTTSSKASPLSPKQLVARASPPLIRRAASASAASPPRTDTTMRYANAAGRGLINIPRRAHHVRSGSESAVGQDVSSSNGRERRGRSRFVLGAAPGESSDDQEASEEEREREKEREEEPSVDKRAARKRPVSADRTRMLRKEIVFADTDVNAEADNYLREPEPESEGMKHDEDDDEASDSECATPTPRSVAKERQVRTAVVGTKGETCAPPVTESKCGDAKITNGDSTVSVPGIAVRARRGRGRRRAVFDDEDLEVEERDGKKETSTIAFPRSAPASPPHPLDTLNVPRVDVVAPTPSSSPQVPQEERMGGGDLCSSFSQKRGLGALHIEIATTDTKDISRRGFVPSGSSYSPPSNIIQMPASAPAETTTMKRTISGGMLSESISLNGMPLIRKKSGEVVKSALRRSSSAPRAAHRASQSLSDISTACLSPSLSAPSSPHMGHVRLDSSSSVPKMVHFGLQIAEYRVYKPEQKPLAVSRGGSPTLDDTTSGGESEDGAGRGVGDFRALQRKRRLAPPGATMSEEEDAVRRALTMRVLNMPRRTPWTDGVKSGASAEDDSDSVLLEGLHLASDSASVLGTVRVKNIAFEKNVAVRFTFDGWQTTSEVLARWVESCMGPGAAPLPPSVAPSPPMSSEGQFNSTPFSAPNTSAFDDVPLNVSEPAGPRYDRFEFAIRLQDMLLRIDEKTLVLAVRYRAAGRELWDNNGGQNYRIVFERRAQTGLAYAGPVAEWSPSGSSGSGSSGPTGGSAGNGGGKEGSSAPSGLGASLHKALEKVASNGNGNSKDNVSSSSKETLEPVVSPTKKPTADSLASRYDLGASLRDKSPWSRPSLDSWSTWAGIPSSFQQARSFPGHGSARPHIGIGHGTGHGAAHSAGPRDYAAHAVAFSTRGLARGSPRDLSSRDDTDLERLSTMRFGTDDEDLPFARGRKDSIERVAHWKSALPTSPPSAQGAFQLGNGNGLVQQHPQQHSETQKSRQHRRSYMGVTGYFDGVPFPAADNGSISPAGARAAGFGATRVRLTPPGSPGGTLGTGHRMLSLDSANLSPHSSHAGTPSLEMTPTMRYAAHARSGAPQGMDANPPSSASAMATWSAGGHFWGAIAGGGGLGIAVPSGAALVGDAADSEVSTPSIASIVTSPTVTSPASPPDYGMLSPLMTPGGEHAVASAVRETVSLDSSDYSALFHRICRYTGPGSDSDVDTELAPAGSVVGVGDFRRSHSASNVDAGYYAKSSPRASATPTMASVAAAFEQAAARYSPGGAAVTPTATHFAASVF